MPNVGEAVNWLKRIFGGPGRGAERRRYPRYPVAAILDVEYGGESMGCTLDNVSAGGVRLVPKLPGATAGTAVTVRHAPSGLALSGRVVGDDSDGTRVQFDSEDAGIVVSSWLRLTQGDAGDRTAETR